MKLLVTGATGLIGSRFCELLQNTYEIVPLGSQDIDITTPDEVSRVFKSHEFDVLVHFAAYTNVDKAEIDRETAYRINVRGSRNVCNEVHKLGKQMIHISTDFVFDGTHPPYTESSIPHALGYYAQTKSEAESEVRGKATIVRISYPYGTPRLKKKDFVGRIRELLETDTPLQMSADSLMTPTFIDDIVNGLELIMQRQLNNGIYHLVGPTSLSPYDAGMCIAKRFGLPQALISKTTLAMHTKGKAPRPQFGVIKNTLLPIAMRSFEEGLLLLPDSPKR